MFSTTYCTCIDWTFTDCDLRGWRGRYSYRGFLFRVHSHCTIGACYWDVTRCLTHLTWSWRVQICSADLYVWSLSLHRWIITRCWRWSGHFLLLFRHWFYFWKLWTWPWPMFTPNFLWWRRCLHAVGSSETVESYSVHTLHEHFHRFCRHAARTVYDCWPWTWCELWHFIILVFCNKE